MILKINLGIDSQTRSKSHASILDQSEHGKFLNALDVMTREEKMCILFIYTNPTPQKGSYRFIVASNRDEYYRRPAKDAFLCQETNVIGGWDMEKGREGGMWLGTSLKEIDDCKFRFGALLNVTVTEKERKANVAGRGHIVGNYLKYSNRAEEYINNLQHSNASYNPFNFVALELSANSSIAYHHSNVENECCLFDGEQILGFGNSPPSNPLVKVVNGKEKFAKIVNSHNKIEEETSLINELLNLLKWEQRHLPDEELIKRSPVVFEYLSAIYVKIALAGYGTRTHSVILIDDNWNLQFIEETMKEPIDVEQPIWLRQNIKAQL